MLNEMLAEFPGLIEGMWSEAELRALLAADTEQSDVDAEPQIERAAELQTEWGTTLGQIWAVGKHLVICADATRPESYERLFGQERYALIVTDPPYGISYADKTRHVRLAELLR